MAKGKKCSCGYYMYAVEEKEMPAGTYVIYECRACGNRIREFESK